MRMSPRSGLLAALVFGSVVLARPGLAQPRSGGAVTGQAPDTAAPPGGASGPTDGADKKPAREAAGYAYGDKPTILSRGQAPRARYRGTGPTVNLPGFEQTPDGGSRLFVQLSQNVPVEERKTAGSITYVLKGASPRVWNNTNALVTVHFNTPVASAKLVPHGADLHFIVDLRAAATPTWKMSDAQDRTAVLSVDFPKGEWKDAPPVQAEPPAATAAPAKPAPRGKRAPAKPAPPPTPAP